MFKRSVKTIDVELNELSQILVEDVEDPIFNNLNRSLLDYSIESLQEIENYLEMIKKSDELENNYNKVVLRVGAYVGEVVKRLAKKEYHWVDYDNAIKLNKEIKKYGKQISLVAVLYSKDNGQFLFPISKVSKFIENGSSDSLLHYTQVFVEV